MLFDPDPYPEDVCIYVEFIDRLQGWVLFDFINDKEFVSFKELHIQSKSNEQRSMVLLKHYHGKRVQENTIYRIKKSIIGSFSQEERILEYSSDGVSSKSESQRSLVIGYVINMLGFATSDIFQSSNFSKEQKFDKGLFQTQLGTNSHLIPSNLPNKLKAVVRNVGQANWNEIWNNDQLVLVYDCGCPMFASESAVRLYIGDRARIISNHKPGLILSHWDLDHYHALLGLADYELESFDYVLCPNYTPTRTSQELYQRIIGLIGTYRVFSIPSITKNPNVKKNQLALLSNPSGNLLLFNAVENKNRNISGLLLSLRNHNSSIIFPADAHYRQISQYILPHLSYKHNHHLVVPHHGGNAGKFEYDFKNLMPQEAIISVGPNSYGHPKNNNIVDLRGIRFHVTQTRIKSQDIEVLL